MAEMKATVQRASKFEDTPPKPRVVKDPRNDKIFLCKFYLAGKRYTLSTGATEQRAAKKEAADIVRREWLKWKDAVDEPSVMPGSRFDEDVPKEPTPSKNAFDLNTPLADVFQGWLAEYGKNQPRSLKTVKSTVMSIKKWFSHELLKDVTYEKASLMQDSMIPCMTFRSCHSVLTYFKKFGDWCVEKGSFAKNPLEKIDPRKKGNYGGIHRNRDLWTEIFFKEFLKHMRPRDRRVLKIYWHTGMDICDIARIEIKHIKRYSDGHHYIELLRLKAKDKSIDSKEVIRFPLINDPIKGNPELYGLIMEALEDAKEEEKTLLFGKEGIDPTELTRRLTNKRNEVFRIYYPDQPKLTWKALRHTFFSRCRDRGIPDPVLVKWGGWVDASMLYRIYDKTTTTAEHLGKLNRQKSERNEPQNRDI